MLMVSLAEADQAVGKWLSLGAKFDVAGGIWKRKPVVHDIDLVVKRENLGSVLRVVSANKARVPVEIYIPYDGFEAKLLIALRATTYEAINQRLMAGLRYSKRRVV
jgi:hypothetical protein